MDSKTIAGGIVRAVIVLCGIALLLYFLYQIQSVLIYIVIAMILTLIGTPIACVLKERLKFNNVFATIFTLLFFVAFMAGLVMLFIPLVSSQAHNLSLLNSRGIENNINALLNQISTFLGRYNIDGVLMLQELRANQLNFSFIPNFLNNLLAALSDFGVGFASVVFISFFFLKDRKILVESARKIIPDEHEEKILNSLRKANNLLSRYFIGLLLQLSIVTSLYLIVLLIFGVKNAFVIAFLCGVLNIVPYIGPVIATILAAFLTMLSHLGDDFQTETLPITIYVFIGFWIVQIIDNNLSQPLIFSKSVRSHPLEIFLIILIAGFAFGILGMIIAVPGYTAIKVFAKEFFPENKIVQSLTQKI